MQLNLIFADKIYYRYRVANGNKVVATLGEACILDMVRTTSTNIDHQQHQAFDCFCIGSRLDYFVFI